RIGLGAGGGHAAAHRLQLPQEARLPPRAARLAPLAVGPPRDRLRLDRAVRAARGGASARGAARVAPVGAVRGRVRERGPGGLRLAPVPGAGGGRRAGGPARAGPRSGRARARTRRGADPAGGARERGERPPRGVPGPLRAVLRRPLPRGPAPVGVAPP